jgi:hypothetical protein
MHQGAVGRFYRQSAAEVVLGDRKASFGSKKVRLFGTKLLLAQQCGNLILKNITTANASIALKQGGVAMRLVVFTLRWLASEMAGLHKQPLKLGG